MPNRTKKSPVEAAIARKRLTAEQRQGHQTCADAAAWKPVAAPTLRKPLTSAEAARSRLEITRTKLLHELERITAEVRGYATDGVVDYGHVGSLSGVLEGVDQLHMVGRAYKAEVARDAEVSEPADPIRAAARRGLQPKKAR